MREAITGAEMDAIPFGDRHYTCQQCGKGHPDGQKFRMVTFLGIGFVICLDCILGFGESPDA